MPKVSIILPTYNGARFISQAIGSVLLQNFHDFELIVIDDGSADDTAVIIKRLIAKDKRIHTIRNKKNLGIQKSLNIGLKSAAGEYIARIDDDDAWIDPGKLASQVEFLDSHPEYVLIGTGVVVQDETNRELFRFLNPLTDSEIRCKLLYRNCFTHSTVLFRKDAALAVGGYDESVAVQHIEDYDLWLKLGMRGKFANLNVYTARFMVRDQAISTRYKLRQFINQRRLIRQYQGVYPGYAKASFLSLLRLIAYWCGGFLVPQWLRNKTLSVYKRT